MRKMTLREQMMNYSEEHKENWRKLQREKNLPIETETERRETSEIGMCPWCGEPLHPGRKCHNEVTAKRRSSQPKGKAK